MAEPFFSLRLIDTIGMHTSDTGDITFDNVRIPHDYLIGEEGKGFFYQMETFQNERMLVKSLIVLFHIFGLCSSDRMKVKRSSVNNVPAFCVL